MGTQPDCVSDRMYERVVGFPAVADGATDFKLAPPTMLIETDMAQLLARRQLESLNARFQLHLFSCVVD